MPTPARADAMAVGPGEAGQAGGVVASGKRRIGVALAVQLLAALVLADGPSRWAFVLLAGLVLPGLWLAFMRRASSLPGALLARIEGFIALEMAAFALGKVLWQHRGAGGLEALLAGRGGAWMPYALGALALQLLLRLWLLNLNARDIRFANAGSLALVLALLGAGEAAARFSYLERTLRDDTTAQIIQEHRYLTQVRQHRDWPDRFFPAAFPARQDPGRLRIVAMGGSSTAGAYQMRDLRLFYPFRLEQRLDADPAAGPAEVLNQGVGGWNTVHIRHYLETSIDALKPDLVTLYVGHNDILTRSSLPYRQLWEQLERGGTAESRLQDRLARLRLYVLFKESLLVLRDGAGQSAVPIGDGRDNLRAIIQTVQARGGRVLLLSEALNPDPQPLEPYFAMMEAVARETGSSWLDTARILWLSRESGLFLDDCHLSERGHQVLADAIYDHLKRTPALMTRGGGGR